MLLHDAISKLQKAGCYNTFCGTIYRGRSILLVSMKASGRKVMEVDCTASEVDEDIITYLLAEAEVLKAVENELVAGVEMKSATHLRRL